LRSVLILLGLICGLSVSADFDNPNPELTAMVKSEALEQLKSKSGEFYKAYLTKDQEMSELYGARGIGHDISQMQVIVADFEDSLRPRCYPLSEEGENSDLLQCSTYQGQVLILIIPFHSSFSGGRGFYGSVFNVSGILDFEWKERADDGFRFDEREVFSFRFEDK
jgi:hypothetical protein